MLLPESVTRVSTCEIEADIMAADITNRKTVTGTYCSNPYSLLFSIKVKFPPLHVCIWPKWYIWHWDTASEILQEESIALQPVSTYRISFKLFLCRHRNAAVDTATDTCEAVCWQQ
jgi:hypothetical protein